MNYSSIIHLQIDNICNELGHKSNISTSDNCRYYLIHSMVNNDYKRGERIQRKQLQPKAKMRNVSTYCCPPIPSDEEYQTFIRI